jgi:hypothetical protein
MKYEVISGRLNREPGTTVDETELAGLNVDALIAGGHIAAVEKKKAAKAGDTTEEKEG